MKYVLSLVMIAAFAAGACGKDKESKKAADETPPAEAVKPDKPVTPPPADLPPIPDEALPVETDFEEAAEKEITTDNFVKELDALEKEISAGEEAPAPPAGAP